MNLMVLIIFLIYKVKFQFTVQSIIGATDMRGCKDGRAVMNKPKNKEKTKAEIIRAFG